MINGNPTSSAEIMKYLKGVSFPASGQDVVNKARENGAPEEVVSKLEQTAGREETFTNPQEVLKKVGQTA